MRKKKRTASSWEELLGLGTYDESPPPECDDPPPPEYDEPPPLEDL
jgi:hypothetical protein